MKSPVIRVEFHCHTNFSGDSLLKPEKLVESARRKGLDRVIVTDHNSIQGALIAREIDPERIIVGEEILTTKGELLAVFVTEHVPTNLTPMEAIQRLRNQGAFISVSHPFDPYRGWKFADLMEILPFVDSIETFNARCQKPEYNIEAQEFAREHGIPGTVGSDAHTAWELGRAVLIIEEFGGSDDLRRVISRSKTEVRQTPPLYIRLSSRFILEVRQAPPLCRLPAYFANKVKNRLKRLYSALKR